MHRAPEAELVDGSVLLALREFRMPDEPDPAQEVVAAFLEVTPARLAGLRQAAQRRDATELRAIAHMVRGSSGTVGATALLATASELEALDSLDQADALVAALEAVFARTRPLLEALVAGGHHA